MPQAFTYLFAYAASSAGLAIGSTALVALGWVATAASFYAIGSYQKRKAKAAARAAYNARLEDRLIMTATTDGARSRVYGRVRNTDGVLFKATFGDNKESYRLIVALAGHEVEEIESTGIYFGDQRLVLDGTPDADGYYAVIGGIDKDGNSVDVPYAVTDPNGKTGSVACDYTAGQHQVELPVTPTAVRGVNVYTPYYDDSGSVVIDSVVVTVVPTTLSITTLPESS